MSAESIDNYASDAMNATNCIDTMSSSKHFDLDEEILTESANRFVLFPIRYKNIWEMYKKAEAAFWVAEEIDLSKDWSDWERLTDNERHFIKHVLAFFAGSDGIVNENLGARFMNEVKPQEAKSFYGFQIAMENIHCVAGSTQVYTRGGYFPIEKLAGETVQVWNGKEWSETTVYKTASDAELYRVSLSNGMTLDCTSEHKWIMGADCDRVPTKDLRIGMALSQFDYPDYHALADPDIWSNPHEHGFMALDNNNKYMPTMFSCRDQYDVPINYSIATKTHWLSGMLKHAIINRDNATELLCIHHTNETFVRHLQLLFTTLGIHTTKYYAPSHKTWCVALDRYNTYKLMQFNHVIIPGLFSDDPLFSEMDSHAPQPPASLITISHIAPLTELGDTFCFDEPLRHMGVFNGILTGQSETYSILIDTYIRDSQEKYRLLNAINTIPCIRKKADWALRWIDDQSSCFAKRLVAFACVEGIFFSGAFCAIFWLKERGVMPGLCLSNEFISRDEALHTEFAVLLYSMLKNKLSQDTIHTIVKEAVEIEDEFINESIPCRLLGMNSDLMSQYIKYVADRLIVQLGYDKIYNVTNPFHFMDRINLEHKANFFEDRNSQYSKANIGNTKEAIDFNEDTDF